MLIYQCSLYFEFRISTSLFIIIWQIVALKDYSQIVLIVNAFHISKTSANSLMNTLGRNSSLTCSSFTKNINTTDQFAEMGIAFTDAACIYTSVSSTLAASNNYSHMHQFEIASMFPLLSKILTLNNC